MPDSINVPCGIAIPQVFQEGPVDMDLVKKYVERAEGLGYHSLWVQERIMGESPTLEGLSLLCYVAAWLSRYMALMPCHGTEAWELLPLTSISIWRRPFSPTPST